ncbi:Reverse transcriptase domain-containing protein [Vibrio chagasii]|nr:Reverse transcriptase domain-containing protein [Vibrio chagasii]CAH6887892.1 Reverse transcriptase domain-containing protein [Vibrio chagasii]CAH6901827.1 Reverse transcriptase domain-containing protein [Vibrio chagasii]CAH7203167.1 Reverse transcriptase domain-containing protein [Vibrio chagasii]CAH7222640.1 Reverse transcriptase domain-containing protein [Vibrio chagasii]
MFDQSFTHRTINRQLEKSDFISYPELRTIELKKYIVSSAVEFSETSHFLIEDFSSKLVRNKPVYQLGGLPKNLVLRKVNTNIKRYFGLKQTDRDVIVKQLKCILQEQISYNIYRLDIKQFYESITKESVLRNVDVGHVNYRTKNFISNFLDAFQTEDSKGVPRGISLSATLSELVMRDFDKYVSKHSEVFYYARFVDDIVIVTSTREEDDFLDLVESNLPEGLVFNTEADGSEKRTLIKTLKGNINKESYFSYLGYKFTIKKPKSSNTKVSREVLLDISGSKAKKIKTRIMKSFIYYQINGDFSLLIDRVKILTSNFSLLDKKKKVQVMSGIYYNYKRVDFDSSIVLKELDVLLKRIIYTQPKLSKKATFTLNKRQKKELLKYSFSMGFEERKRVYFTPSRQQRLQRTWKDEK